MSSSTPPSLANFNASVRPSDDSSSEDEPTFVSMHRNVPDSSSDDEPTYASMGPVIQLGTIRKLRKKLGNVRDQLDASRAAPEENEHQVESLRRQLQTLRDELEETPDPGHTSERHEATAVDGGQDCSQTLRDEISAHCAPKTSA